MDAQVFDMGVLAKKLEPEKRIQIAQAIICATIDEAIEGLPVEVRKDVGKCRINEAANFMRRMFNETYEGED